MLMDRRALLAGLSATCVLPGCAKAAPPSVATRLVSAARQQVGVTLTYDSGYSKLAFPGGDVPRARGVCTDVLIRAYRDALGQDLQVLVNRDMRAAFSAYPKRWGLHAPDSNIDHRRVSNLQTWFKRHGAQLPVPGDRAGWRPGHLRLPDPGVDTACRDRVRPARAERVARHPQYRRRCARGGRSVHL
jgi:uncharacterized protein YijF (DUF1287 family)